MRDVQEDRRDLRHYLRLVWRRKWLLLAVILAIPAAVYGISTTLPKTYEASTVLQVRQTAISSNLFAQGIATTSSIEGVARLIRTTAVAREAAQELGESQSSARALLGDIRVESESAVGSDINREYLTIIGTGAKPHRAADLANAFAEAVAGERTKQAVREIDRTIATLTEEARLSPPSDVATRESLAQQLQDLRALRASQAGTTEVIEPAFPPGAAVSPQPVRNAALGLVLAVLLAAGLIPLLERLDRRLREADELEELAGAPILGMIPDAAFPGRAAGPHVREAFQTLRAALTYFNVDRSMASLLITSAARGEGKTTVAAQLAVALAQDERDVILVDADLRHPKLDVRLGTRGGPGLAGVLVGEGSLEQALLEVEVGAGRLRLLPGGSAPNPSVLLGSRRMRSLLGELSEQADILVIDTPPVLTVSDAIPLLEQVSGTALMARVNYSSRDAISRAAQVVRAAGGSVVGVVATGTRVGGLYGYDDYGYGYGAAEEPETPAAAQNGKRGLRRRISRKS